jgi:hypothetical protein
VTALALASGEPARSWEDALAAVIRPEFAVERYVPRPGSVLFGKRKCAVPACVLPTHRSLLLCGGHDRQWRRPRGDEMPAEEWAELDEKDGGPSEMRGRASAVKCAVAACPRAARSPVPGGLCGGHYERWRVRRDKSVSLNSFIATVSTTLAPVRDVCRVPDCPFPRRGTAQLCEHHQLVFKIKARHRPSDDPHEVLEDFLARSDCPGMPLYSVAELPSPLRSELQFALQCRSDDRRVGFYEQTFSAVTRVLRERGVRSLLDHDATDPIFNGKGTGRFLRYARERLEHLADNASGVSEWERDVWRVARLSTGLSVDTVAWNLRTLRLFVEFCQTRGTVLGGPGAFSRELLEAFAAHLFSLGLHPRIAQPVAGSAQDVSGRLPPARLDARP